MGGFMRRKVRKDQLSLPPGLLPTFIPRDGDDGGGGGDICASWRAGCWVEDAAEGGCGCAEGWDCVEPENLFTVPALALLIGATYILMKSDPLTTVGSVKSKLTVVVYFVTFFSTNVSVVVFFMDVQQIYKETVQIQCIGDGLENDVVYGIMYLCVWLLCVIHSNI
jgi:hypothetical protein